MKNTSQNEGVRQASRLIEENLIDEAIEMLFPINSNEALTILASCYSLQGDLEKALSTINHVLDNSVGAVNKARSLNNKALLLIDNNELEEAKHLFAEALDAVEKCKSKRKRTKERDKILVNVEFCVQQCVSEALCYITHPLSYQCLHELMVLGEPLLNETNEWKLVKSKRRVDIFRKKQMKDATGRTINAFKGVGVVRGKPRAMASLVTDVGDYRRQLDPFFKKGTVVSKEAEVAIVHLVFQTSKCVIEIHRDFLICQHMYELANGTVVVASRSHIDQQLVSVEPNCVRGDILMAGWIFEPTAGGLCNVTYVTRADLKEIPATILNSAAESQPLIIDRLRRLLVKIDEEKSEARYEFEVEEMSTVGGKNAFGSLSQRPRGSTADNMLLPSPVSSPRSASPAQSPLGSPSTSPRRSMTLSRRSKSEHGSPESRSPRRRASVSRGYATISKSAKSARRDSAAASAPVSPRSGVPQVASLRKAGKLKAMPAATGTGSRASKTRSAPGSPRHSVHAQSLAQFGGKTKLPSQPIPQVTRKSPLSSPRRALPATPQQVPDRDQGPAARPNKPLPQMPFFSFPPLESSQDLGASSDDLDSAAMVPAVVKSAPGSPMVQARHPAFLKQESEMIDLDEIAALNNDLVSM